MSDKVIVPVPGIGALALDVQTYRRALAEGAALIGAPAGTAPDAEPLLDDGELAAALKVPRTRVEQLGREGRIPSVPVGRYRRYRLSAVERALSANGHRD